MVAKGGEKKKKGVKAQKEEENHPVEEKVEVEISAEKTASKGGKQSVKDPYFRDDDDSSEEKVDANLAVANPGKRKRRCVHKRERMLKRKRKNLKEKYGYMCNQKIKRGPGGGPGGPGGGDAGGGGGNDPGGAGPAGGSMGMIPA